MTWQEAVMGASGMAFLLVLIVVVIVQGAATWRARMSVAREEAYRRLAEEATRAQQQTAEQLERIRAELSTVNERTASLERVLTEVGEPWERR
jgi:Tfp pilus assembly protein PilO